MLNKKSEQRFTTVFTYQLYFKTTTTIHIFDKLFPRLKM